MRRFAWAVTPSVFGLCLLVPVAVAQEDRIQGRVLDSQGNPVRDAVVQWIAGTERGSATSDANGNYTIRSARTGPFHVWAFKPRERFPSDPVRVEVPAAGVLNRDLRNLRRVRLRVLTHGTAVYAIPYDISDAGTVVGDARFDGGGFSDRFFVNQERFNGDALIIGALDETHYCGTARDVFGTIGNVNVGWRDLVAGARQPLAIPALPGFDTLRGQPARGMALSVNRRGVAGTLEDNVGGRLVNVAAWYEGMAAAWQTAPQTILSPSYDWSEGRNANAAGWVAGVSTGTGQPDRAFLFRTAPPVVLELPGLGGATEANGINDLGFVVGSSYLPPPGPHRAILWAWSPQIALPVVPYVLPAPGGAIPAEWGTLANRINNAGRIVGRASGFVADLRGVLWHILGFGMDLNQLNPNPDLVLRDAAAINALDEITGWVALEAGPRPYVLTTRPAPRPGGQAPQGRVRANGQLFEGEAIEIKVGEPLYLDASESSGANLRFDWNFSDGGEAGGIETVHTFDAADTYSVILTITDDYDDFDKVVIPIIVTGDNDALKPSASKGEFLR